MTQEADAFLRDSTFAKSAKWPALGTTYSGEIVSYKMMDQLNRSGRPEINEKTGEKKRQMLITIQTTLSDDEEDNGRRTLWVKQGQMQQAIADALFKAGVKSMDNAIGGKLVVRFVSEKPPKTEGFSKQKIYQAAFKPGEKPSESKSDLEDLLAGSITRSENDSEKPATPARGTMSFEDFNKANEEFTDDLLDV